MNIVAEYSEYSYSTDADVINSYTQAFVLEDTSWMNEETKAGSVIGTDAYEGKGVTFYAQLAKEGLWLGAIADHGS